MADGNTRHLLSADEPGPFKVLNPLAELPILLVCDHASCRFPKSLGDMGLDPFARRCHLAVDIGASALTERLAASIGVTAVLANYSRLVVDCNRQLMDPGAFLEFGDGVLVPGNRNLRQSDKDLRSEALYWPYHEAVDQQVQRLRNAGRAPAFIAVHSFTPVMNGEARHGKSAYCGTPIRGYATFSLRISRPQATSSAITNRILAKHRKISRSIIMQKKSACRILESKFVRT